MPSETYYLKHRHVQYLDEQANERDGVSNPSQALREILDEYERSGLDE